MATRKQEASGREYRLRHGRDQRARISRARLGQVPARERKFDPIDLLLQATEGRVPALLPIKYSRMSASPFAFFRGAVSIMAADLSNQAHTGLLVQLCGDAHVQNLGSFEAPDARVVFDINDFDETAPGPWEWDVKRMAASIVLAGWDSKHGKGECAGAVEEFAVSYCEWIEQLADEPILVAARHQIHQAKKASAVSAAFRQAERATPMDLLEKYTEADSRGRRRFKKT